MLHFARSLALCHLHKLSRKEQLSIEVHHDAVKGVGPQTLYPTDNDFAGSVVCLGSKGRSAGEIPI